MIIFFGYLVIVLVTIFCFFLIDFISTIEISPFSDYEGENATLLVGFQNNLRWKVLFQVLLKGNTSNLRVPLGGSAQSQKHMI